MGLITVFALESCPHCKRAKSALTERSIPYTEISLSTHPEKRTDMLSLADRLTVPQVFFNEVHIGGADDLIETLDTWEKEKKYATALERYEQEILSQPDPVDPRLQVPTTPPVVEKPPPPRDNEKSVEMPDGSKESVLEVTLKLMEILPKQNLKYNLTVYKNAFTGKDAVVALQKHYDLKTSEEAVRFGERLVRSKIIKHVHGEHDFKNEALYYRLQCYDQPQILNSFRIWQERVDSDVMGLLTRLKKLLGKIESAVTNNDGLVDYKSAPKHEYWPEFEEAVCELQGVSLEIMERNMKLAFAINLYNLMIKYGFMKLGIGNTSGARGAFFTGVKFNIGGHILSFNDLEHGIIRGNAKPAYSLTTQFSSSDPRARLTVENPDCRIHFALNCGAKSCPPVKNFSTVAIEEELRIVAQSFCEQEDNVKVDEENNSLHLTMILSWFRADFAGSNKELPAKLVTFLRGEKKASLQKMLDSKKSISINFNTYDWGTNASDYVPFEKDVLVVNASGVKAILA